MSTPWTVKRKRYGPFASFLRRDGCYFFGATVSFTRRFFGTPVAVLGCLFFPRYATNPKSLFVRSDVYVPLLRVQ